MSLVRGFTSSPANANHMTFHTNRDHLPGGRTGSEERTSEDHKQSEDEVKPGMKSNQ
jgi:hypothetical protein